MTAATETRARKLIRKHLATYGLELAEAHWDPLSMGSEMSGGCDGGWTVYTTDDQHFIGENVDELLGYIDDHASPAVSGRGEETRP